MFAKAQVGEQGVINCHEDAKIASVSDNVAGILVRAIFGIPCPGLVAQLLGCGDQRQAVRGLWSLPPSAPWGCDSECERYRAPLKEENGNERLPSTAAAVRRHRILTTTNADGAMSRKPLTMRTITHPATTGDTR